MQFSDWAEKLVAIALKEPEGERFLTISVCLEYLHEKSNGNYHGDYNLPVDTSDDAVEGVERDDNDEQDLEAEGADWLADQGFDRLG